MHVHRFGNAVMGPAWSLKYAELLMHFQRARDNDDRHMGQQLLEIAEVIQAQFAMGKDMVQDNETGRVLDDVLQSCGSRRDSFERIFRQRFFIDLILEIIIFDDENARIVHGLAQGYASEGTVIKS